MTGFGGVAVLVTGAAGGLGRACAEHLAADGAAVALSDLPGDQLDETVRDLRAAGATAEAFPADLAIWDEAERLPAGVVERMGELRGVVVATGIMQTKPFLDLTEDDWRRMLDVNLTGAFALTQAAGRLMGEGGGGSIVLVASVAARSGRPLAAHYSAAKTGLLSVTKSAAAALAPKVRVNAVCPGLFLTPMWDRILEDRRALEGPEAAQEFLDKVTTAAVLGRAGEPSELAAAISFLLSDAASFVTGQALNVDGGLEMD